MTTADDFRVELDDNVLDRLAGLICGDDGTPYYRKGFEIVRFFEAAEWKRVGDLDGGRKAWTIDRLKARRRDSDALRRLILRLADPREYLDEDEVRVHVVEELNALLAIEGYQVIYVGSKPELTKIETTLKRPAMKVPVQLAANLSEIVSDLEFGAQLKDRLDEAHICWDSGAPIAAVIMLGSLLEGVLYDVALSRCQEGKKPDDNLEKLINLAKDNGWFAQDVVDYAHVLRNHRNLVHPKKQLTQGYKPADHTVRIAWNVVVAALNDLAMLDKVPSN